MEKRDSTTGVTAYELATLASRIGPGDCIREPKQAIATAERLLHEAEAAIDRVYQEKHMKDWEKYQAGMARLDWVTALKEITGQTRKDRAEARFRAYMQHEEPQCQQAVTEYQREGCADPFHAYARA